MIFLHRPADPFDSVDPDYELRTDAYEWTLISIQDTRSYGGGYVVNQYGPGPTADDIEWSKRSARPAPSKPPRNSPSRHMQRGINDLHLHRLPHPARPWRHG